MRRRNLLSAAIGSLLIAGVFPSTVPALAIETSSTLPKCTITGTQGPDRLNGTAGNDVICGFGGNDFLAGRGGNDVLIGGLGNDQLSGELGRDTLNGGFGDDVLIGGFENDQLKGDAGRDTLIGGSGNDVLIGGADNDQLSGEVGRDTLNGGLGNDQLIGGIENDELRGETGSDTLIGGSGNDVLIGGADNDQLSGELGRDMLMGDSGNDALVGGAQGDSFAGGTGTDTIDAGTAGDTCATDAADVIRGACQNDLTGPVISEVAVVPVVNAGTVLAFSWRVSDSSGLHISDAYTPTTWVKIGGANGWIGWCGVPIYARQVSGDMNTGVFYTNCLIPEIAVNGEYTFWLDALDIFGNHPSAETSGTFTVTSGTSDNTPPVLSDVTVSAPTFAAGDAITIEWNATDESGVSGSIPWAFGPNGFLVNLASGQLWLEYGLGTLISGTEFDGRYRITLQLSASAIPGTYSLWFSTNDVLGNHSYAPVSVTFTVR